MKETTYHVTTEAKETWKPIPGFEGMYEVSDLGRVKSIERYIRHLCRNGKLFDQHVPEKIREPFIAPNGYKTIRLWNHGTSKMFTVHRLVLTVFSGPPVPPFDHGMHLNHNRLDNRINNLKWGSHKENMQMDWQDGRRKAYAHWTGKTGVESPRSKAIILLDGNGLAAKEWPNARLAGEALKINARAIRKCAAGELKSTSGYTFKYKSDYQTPPTIYASPLL